MSSIHLLLLYLLTVNVVAFVAYGVDKYKARHAKWRTPERLLLGLAIVGGSVGALAGMRVWHHKTRHLKFRYGVPVILAVQVVVAVYLIFR